MANAPAPPKRDLLYYVNHEATPEEQNVFKEMWEPTILTMLCDIKFPVNLWPQNVDLALRCTLARAVLSMDDEEFENVTIPQFVDHMNKINGMVTERITSDTPGPVHKILQAVPRENDPFKFAQQTLVYRTANVLSQAAKTIEDIHRNLEKATRKIMLENAELEMRLKRIVTLDYIQRQFADKFNLINPIRR